MAETNIRKPSEILESILATYRSGLEDLGIDNPQVGPGTDIYLLANAISNEIAVASQNVISVADSLMPDSATGEDLDRCLSTYGISRRQASVSTGIVKLTSTATTLVSEDTQLISPNGQLYKTTTTGNYANGSEIEITSIVTGSNTNLAIGTVLKWVQPPAFASQTVVVSQAVTGGVDAEDDETARSRLLDRLRNPPVMGNWSQIAEISEENPMVQKAFVYPIHNGPSTLAIALAASPTSTSKSRQISDTNISQISSEILGNIPEYVETTINSVEDVKNDVAFELTLPYPEGAMNNGSGGGWANFNPYPLLDSTRKNCKVTNVTNSLRFLVDSPPGKDPEKRISKVSWINKNTFQVKTATVLDYIGAGPYQLILDKPFTGIEVGDFIFPSCAKAQVYLEAVLAQFAKMGCGQVTNIVSILSKAYRRPSYSYPSAVGGEMLRGITNSSSEVLSATISYLQHEGEPTLPSSVKGKPKIFIPNRIAFYPSKG